jgi:hypothetical protein
MKNNKWFTVGIVSESNRKCAERGNIAKTLLNNSTYFIVSFSIRMAHYLKYENF